MSIAKLLVEEVVPLFGVPEALLSDRGTNLSYLMKEICAYFGVRKLNTTAYHPQYDGMFERPSRVCCANMRRSLARNGTLTFTELYGLTGIRPMKALERSPLFCCMVMIAVRRQKLHSYNLNAWSQLQWKTTERKP